MKLQNDRLFHGSLAIFIVVMLLMISLNIQLSSMRVAFTTQVYGSGNLLAGQPAALRFTALEGDNYTFEQDLSVEARLVYAEDGQDFKIFSGSNSLGDTLEMNFTVPERLGEAMIIATLDTADGQEFVKIPVKVIPKTLPGHFHWLKVNESMAKTKEGGRFIPAILPNGKNIYAYPESGRLAPRVENTIYFFSQPDRNQIFWNFSEPIVVLQPDSWNVAKISHNPDIMPTYQMELEASELPDANTDHLKMTLEVAPSQMMLKLNKYWAEPGAEIAADLFTLRRQETVYLDVWYEGTLLFSQAMKVNNGRASYKFRLPEKLEGLFFVQIYRPFINPGETQDGRALYVTSQHDEPALWKLVDKMAALGANEDPLISFLQSNHPQIPWDKGDHLPQLIMSRLEKDSMALSLLYDSGPTKTAAFNEQLKTSRHRLYQGYVATGILLLLLLITFSVIHVRATRDNVTKVLEESPELADDDKLPEISLIPPKISLILMAMGLLISFWAIAILLENLRWTVW